MFTTDRLGGIGEKSLESAVESRGFSSENETCRLGGVELRLLVRLDLRCSRGGRPSLDELLFVSSSAAAATTTATAASAAPVIGGGDGGAEDRFEAIRVDSVCVEQSGIISLRCRCPSDCNDVKAFVRLWRGLRIILSSIIDPSTCLTSVVSNASSTFFKAMVALPATLFRTRRLGEGNTGNTGSLSEGGLPKGDFHSEMSGRRLLPAMAV
jgi:hypothetical protein